MSISIKILNLGVIADKKVYYKNNGKFVPITNPSMVLSVDAYGAHAAYPTGKGVAKLVDDFYVKAENGRGMVSAPTVKRTVTVNAVNPVTGREFSYEVEATRKSNNTVSLYVELVSSDGTNERINHPLVNDTYPCKTNGFGEGSDPQCIAAQIQLETSTGHMDPETAEFFAATEIEGEERIPSYAERVMIPKETTDKVVKILQNAFREIKDLGVLVCYDENKEGFKLLNGKKEDFRFGSRSEVTDEEIFVPDEAFSVVPLEATPFGLAHTYSGVIMKR